MDTLVLVADHQVITDRDLAGDLPEVVVGLVLDQLAAGLDPERTTVFCHSAVPALNQLLLPFLSLVSVAARSTRPPTSSSAAQTSSRSAATSCRTWS